MTPIKAKINCDTVLLYLIALSLILTGPSIYHYLEPPVLSSFGAKLLLYIFCLLYIILNGRIPKKAIYLCFTMAIYLLGYLIAPGQGWEQKSLFINNFFVPLLLYSIFCCVNVYKRQFKALCKAFSNIMIFFGAVSVFCWIFGTVLNILPFKTQMTYTWASSTRTTYTYFHLYFETQTLSTTLFNLAGLKRNVGIFCEAPGYALYLDCALIIELVASDKVSKKRVGILLLAMITSFSTKGYLIAFIGFFIRSMVFSNRKNRSAFAMKIALGSILLVVSLFAGMMLLNDKLSTMSGSVRLDDLRAGMLTFIQNPIWGVGFENNDAVLKNALVTRNNKGLSMGSSFLAFGGLYMMLLYLGSLLLVCYNKIFEKREFFLFVSMIVTEFFISNVGAYQIFVILVSFGYAFIVLGRNRKRASITQPSNQGM